jgi:hypothetical protein
LIPNLAMKEVVDAFLMDNEWANEYWVFDCWTRIEQPHTISSLMNELLLPASQEWNEKMLHRISLHAASINLFVTVFSFCYPHQMLCMIHPEF